MSGLGFVITPCGDKELVPDKWKYFQKNPESYQRTLEDINAKAAIKAAAMDKDAVRTQPQPISTGKSFRACCIEGSALKACKDCNASGKREGLSCKTCGGLKWLRESCSECKPSDQ